MDSPPCYITVNSLDELASEDGISFFSNLDWGKEQAIKSAKLLNRKQTIYKLVPVFEVSLEVVTNVITKDLSQP